MRLVKVLCAGVSLVTLAGAAFAQQPPTSEPAGADIADDTGQLAPSNDIVVSARRRQESVQDVPQTVNVVTSAQVEKLNLRNFTDIQSIVPGLTLSRENAFSNTASVRGVSFDPRASGTNPSVEFYLNDAPIASGFLFQSTYDFGQFELQRGPQGTLRGRASPSGSIAVTTRRPDLSEVGVVVNGTITDTHARKIDGAFNIPLIADMLAVRVAGVIDNSRLNRVHSTAETNFPGLNEGPYLRTKSLRGSVRFEPTDWIAVNAMYQDLHSEGHSYQQVASDSLFTGSTRTTPLIGPFDRLGIESQGGYDRQDLKIFVANADVSFAGQKLSYVYGWNLQVFGSVATSDPAGVLSPPRINPVVRAPRGPLPTATQSFDQTCVREGAETSALFSTGNYGQCSGTRSRSYSHELRLASDERIAGIFDYVVGGYYQNQSTRTQLTQDTPVFLANPATGAFSVLTIPVTPIDRRGANKERSVFGNVVAHLIDDSVELSGGLRYLNIKSISSIGISGVLQGATPFLQTNPQDENKLIYAGSAKYKISRDIMVYALTGTSFRAGPRVVGDFSVGPNRVGPTPRELQFLNLPSETSRSYEIGTKTSFLQGRGKFNVAAYRQTFKNYPFRGNPVFFINYPAATPTAPNVGAFNFVAPVPVTVKGIEGEASYQILDRWSLGVNAAYADGKIKGGTFACSDLNSDGRPDINPAQPSVAQLQAAVGAGETISTCSGLGRRSTNAPKFSANVQSEFGFDLGQRMDGFVRGLYTFAGKTSNDPDNALDNIGSYGLLNVYTGIRDKDGAWEITVFSKNITKEEKVLSLSNTPLTSTFRTPGVTTFASQYRGITVTAPREFGVTARVALGSR